MKNRGLVVFGVVVLFVLFVSAACVTGFAAGGLFQTSYREIMSGSTPSDLPTLLESFELPEVEQNGIQTPGENDDPAAELETVDQTDVPVEELFGAFWQAWDLVHEEFVDQPVDDVAMMRGAIKGMLESLGDRHTSYLNPEEFQSSEDLLRGQEYEGIGAWVDITGEYLTIISPMPGSPAEEAGLKPGDQIIAVDGEDMNGKDGESVRQKVLGPRGSEVILTVRREGIEEPFDVTVTRSNIVVPSITFEMLDNEIAYVRLYTFGEDTSKDLRNALKELMAENPKGLILDLRNNGGGFLDTAIEVGSEFIKEGVLMYEEFGDGSRRSLEARGNGLATDIPMVVLINEGSASASEIVAGAIQDLDRGELVGITSFGKGSVQTYRPLLDDHGAVRVTIARWLTPSGRTIHEAGLEPDVIIELPASESFSTSDPQVQKAIEILLGK